MHNIHFLDRNSSTSPIYRCVLISDLPHTADDILVLLLCLGTFRKSVSPCLITACSSSQVSNICVHFMWVTYIPSGAPNIAVRTFIANMLEILRRVQWNFCAPSSLISLPLPTKTDARQIVLRTNTSATWINTASRARYHFRITWTRTPMGMKMRNTKRRLPVRACRCRHGRSCG